MTQQIGEFIRDNGGNAWVALGHALQALEAAEAEAAHWREMHDDRSRDLKHEYARLKAAEAELARLRMELTVTRDLLRDAPVPFEDDVQRLWYEAVADYLETLNSGQDAAGG